MASVDEVAREKAILVALTTERHVAVIELARRFGVPAVTVRKDLDLLERRGLLRRVRGGAVGVTGSDKGAFDVRLQIAVQARETLQGAGIGTRVVSVPCLDWFQVQDDDYINEVLQPEVTARVSIEAGIAALVALAEAHGRPISLEHYGASADFKTLYREFGITSDAAVAAAKESLAAARKGGGPSSQPAATSLDHAGVDDPVTAPRQPPN